MKRSLIVLAAAAAVVAFAMQIALPPALAGHAAKLKEAQGLKVKLAVSPVGGATTSVEFSYGKPRLIRIDSPDRLVVSDGRMLSVLDKAKNTYTQEPLTADNSAPYLEATGTWGWESFFQADSAKLFKAAKAGAQTKVRGVDVSPVDVTSLDGKTTATLYIEAKTGVARGYQFHKDGKDYIVWAETVVASAEAPDTGAFSFTAPAGATKVDPAAVAEVTWDKVSSIFDRACMPCHSPNVQSGQLDLSGYDSTVNSRYVVRGKSKVSSLALVLRAAGSGRMPQGRPPLPDKDIKTIEDWIDGGLKK